MNRGKILVFALLVILIFSVEPITRLISATFKENPQAAASKDFKIPDTNQELNSGSNAFLQNLVVIDAGHGGNDPGCEGNKLLEKDISLSVAQLVNKKLSKMKIPVFMIREDDTTTIPAKNRITAANQKGATLYVALHCDWFKDPVNSGTSVLYYPSSKLKAGNLIEKEYAQIMSSELEPLDTESRGIIARNNLAVLNTANMPSVIIELGFLSSKKDASLLSSDTFREKAADAVAKGIVKALQEIYN